MDWLYSLATEVPPAPELLAPLRPWVEFLVLAAAVVTAAAVLWTKFVGPFVARPIGSVIRKEVGEVVRAELKTIERRIGRIETQLSPIDDGQPLKAMVMTMQETLDVQGIRLDKHIEESTLDRSNLWQVLADHDIHDRRSHGVEGTSAS